MLRKIISSILIIIILTLWMPIQAITEVFTSYAITTSWEFNYTGEEQTFEVPYKGIYKIEAYGAQGENYGSYIGGKGGKTSASMLLNKEEEISLFIGGQGSTFNGGGNGSYSNGGGATDVRINGKELEDRVIIAGGGGAASPHGNGKIGSDSENLTTVKGTGETGEVGGGGGYYGGKSGEAIYHEHTGTSTLGGGCYNKPIYHSHGSSCYTARKCGKPASASEAKDGHGRILPILYRWS